MDSKLVAEAPLSEEVDASDDESSDDGLDNHASGATHEDFGNVDDKEVFELMDSAREHLLSGNGGISEGGTLHSDFVLAIVELCRLAEASVPENLEQSLAAHLGVEKKKSRGGIFPTGESSVTKKAEGDDDNEISKRFQLAVSRVLVLYATNGGISAANILCKDLADLAGKVENDIVESPISSSILTVLSVAKRTAIECASIFGGSKRGGPVPKWEDDILPGLSTSVLNRKTGLQLDVERMFKEKITVYPHPSEVFEASRNAVMFLFFKIVFRSLFENARLCIFSSCGYRQLLVDTTFLKHMVPHYVSADFTDKGINGCSGLLTLIGDVVEVIEERCTDESCTHDDNVKQDAREVVRLFVASVQDGSGAEHFIIDEHQAREK
jgi:hypothetical protein